MTEKLRHEAGSDQHQRTGLRMDVIRADLDPTRAVNISRFTEFWCQKHCKGEWRVETTDVAIQVTFEMDRDRVLFHLSEEYDFFAGRAINLSLESA